MQARFKTFNSFILLFIFLAFSFIFFLVDGYFSLRGLRVAFEKLVNPLKANFHLVLLRFLPSKETALSDPIILQTKIDHLSLENSRLLARLNQLEVENEGLKKQLKIITQPEAKYLSARNIAVVEGLMTLDKGESEGVKTGMVVVSEGVLVGKVVSVTPHTSRVKLPNAEGNKIKVKVLPMAEKGMLKGTTEGRLLLEEVLQKVKLEIDQVLVTTGEEGEYPPDLPVARIEKIVSDDVAIYQKAEVKPLLDYQSLKLVMIRI
jgi:rod shape-determining protein MreC